MLLSKTLVIKWNAIQKRYYQEKGYLYTKLGDEFECKVEDIPHSSDRFIQCKCDYCGKEFSKQIKKYYRGLSIIKKDSCSDCGSLKMCESKMIKYGTTSGYVNGNTVEKQKARYSSVQSEIWIKIQNICKEKNYTLLSDKYINNHTNFDYICEKHKIKGIQHSNWIHLKEGKGCKYCGSEKCAESQRHTYEQVKNMIEENTKNILISDVYTGYFHSNLEIKCECNNKFITSLGGFINGKTKCDSCTPSISKGETIITNYLAENKIYYKKQYTYEDCRDTNVLRFDFAILNEDGSVKFLLEYDGQQHFFPVRFNGISEETAILNFKNTKRKDKIKNKYCKKNKIDLIRISYLKLDILEDVLNDIFFQSPLPLCSNL